MNFLNNPIRHIFVSRRNIVLFLLVVVASFFAVFSGTVFADDPSATNDQRLVTIHDTKQEVTVVTRAVTVEAALKQAGVTVSELDIVEPARTEVLRAKTYQVNVFRARPVLVVDGSTQKKVITAEQSPRQIARVAKTALYDEDQVSLDRVDDVLLSGGAGLKMTIKRATVFTMVLFGKKFEARTQAASVDQLLKEKGIVLGSNDGVSPAPQTGLTSGMEVRVWRNGKQTVTQEEVIVRSTEEIKDADKAVGVREVKEPGADGKRNVTYEIETKDGREVARKEIASVTTLVPTKQVVVVGTKVSLPAGSHTDWMAAAGIGSADYGYVDFIISHESGWSPTKYNYAGSGAYGLCQALPASKMASAGGDYMTNPITQLKWCNGYAVGRYGSWAGAYSFWLKNKWW